jgi:membrane protease YdiL (CAAX protease family)
MTIDKKPLAWFLVISFGISWILFSIPLLFTGDETRLAIAMQICFALGMWGPGLAAILVTLFIEKIPFKSLRLNTLGSKPMYLVAWLLPTFVNLATLGVTLAIGTGVYDGSFSRISEALAQVPAGSNLPPLGVLVAIQIASAILFAPFINIVFALGEELGWRGFLLPRLLPLGQWRAILLVGIIWGLWHAPTTLLFGYNFPLHHYLGVLLMVVGCILLGTLLAWLYLKTRSPWAVALAHGAFNATAGLGFLFLNKEVDTALGGSPLGLSGWIVMAILIAILVWMKQIPVATTPDTVEA